MFAHSSEREKSDSEDDASNVETQKRKYSVNANYRKDQKRSIMRTEEIGELKTVERKSESRNNHRYAVVVKVLVIQWNPCKTKTSQETV